MTTHYRYSTVPLENGGTGVWLDTYIPVKETPCGYWLVPDYQVEWSEPNQTRRWVAKSGGKLCQPSLQEAWDAYRRRLRFRVQFLERDLRVARGAQSLTSYRCPPPMPLPGERMVLERADI